MMRHSPPLIEPYVIVTHHTAPLFSYLTLFLDFFSIKDSCPDNVRLASVTRELRGSKGANNSILLRPLLKLFQFHELLVQAIQLCSRNELVALLSIQRQLFYTLDSGFGRFGVTLDLLSLTCSGKYCENAMAQPCGASASEGDYY